MIVLAGLVIGAIWGVISAGRRGGALADKAQWGAVFGLIGLILGLALTVAIDRMI